MRPRSTSSTARHRDGGMVTDVLQYDDLLGVNSENNNVENKSKKSVSSSSKNCHKIDKCKLSILSCPMLYTSLYLCPKSRQ